MNRELYKAAISGDEGYLNDEKNRYTDSEYFVRQTTIQNNNILHLAIRHNKYDFIKELKLLIKIFSNPVEIHKLSISKELRWEHTSPYRGRGW